MQTSLAERVDRTKQYNTGKTQRSSRKKPSEINSLDDLFPYAKACIAEILDAKNYPEEKKVYLDHYSIYSRNKKKSLHKEKRLLGIFPVGKKSVCDIAAASLIQNGFDEYTAKWITNPFHWLMVGKYKHVALNWDGDGSSWYYLDEKFKIAEIRGSFVRNLTEEFINTYGELTLARIRRIREHPAHRPYDSN